MPRLDRLRPDLAALLKADPKNAAKEPLEGAPAPAPMSRAAERLEFAERIGGRHAVESREVRTRPNALAEGAEPVLLEPKSKKRPRRPGE